MIVTDIAAHAVFSGEKMGKTSLVSAEHLYAGLNAFEPGQQHHAHVHHDQDKMYVVLRGSAEISVGERSELVGEGALALAPAGVLHSIRNPGPERLVVLVVFSPPPRRG